MDRLQKYLSYIKDLVKEASLSKDEALAAFDKYFERIKE